MKIQVSRQICEKYLNIKFNWNLSSGRRVVLCRRRDTPQLIVAIHKFANASKKGKQEDQLIIFIIYFIVFGYIQLMFPHYVKRPFEYKPRPSNMVHKCI
jgi:hypothetical protein